MRSPPLPWRPLNCGSTRRACPWQGPAPVHRVRGRSLDCRLRAPGSTAGRLNLERADPAMRPRRGNVGCRRGRGAAAGGQAVRRRRNVRRCRRRGNRRVGLGPGCRRGRGRVGNPSVGGSGREHSGDACATRRAGPACRLVPRLPKGDAPRAGRRFSNWSAMASACCRIASPKSKLDELEAPCTVTSVCITASTEAAEGLAICGRSVPGRNPCPVEDERQDASPAGPPAM